MTGAKFKKLVAWTIGAVFLIFGITVGYPIFRNDRALDRLSELGGDYYSQHYGLIEKMPWSVKGRLKSIARTIHGADPGNRKWAGRYKRIEGYDLRSTDATEDDLEFLLRDQSSVKWLWLEGTEVTGEKSFRHLSGELWYIHARGTSLTDDGVRGLVNVKRLGGLYLAESKITDDALPDLIAIPGLESVYLPLSFSEQAAEKLREARPDCRVRRR